MVGDPTQTIYSFTGASPQYLLDFRVRHPSARLVRLVRDYRSTPQVVALANALADRPRGGGEAMRLLAQRMAGPLPTLTSYEDDVAEAEGIARSAASLVEQGVPAGEIAVLYRTNAQSEALEQALTEAGLPYLVRGGERFFARKEVRDALLLLRGAAVSAAATTTDAAMPTQARDVLASAGWTAQPPSGGGAVRERWESLQALAALSDDLATATRRRPCATWSPSSRSAPRPSTRPPCRGSPWPRCTPRRAWSGMRCS